MPEDSITSLMKSIDPIKGSRVPRGELLHITLTFLGDITEQEERDLCAILKSISMPAFSVATTHVGAFPDLRKARVAFIGLQSPDLVSLHAYLDGKMDEKFRETREFVPHLTISRFKFPMDIRGLYRENEGKNFGTYRIDRVSLYKSELTPEGAVHTERCGVQLI